MGFREMQRKAVSTVGDFLNELRGHWSGKPKTFEDYCRSFRTILAQIFGIKGGREKFDYVKGGRAAWVAKIDRIKLADVTPDKVNKWRIAFVKKAGGNPVKQRRARITCNSLMRQAKSLFSTECWPMLRCTSRTNRRLMAWRSISGRVCAIAARWTLRH